MSTWQKSLYKKTSKIKMRDIAFAVSLYISMHATGKWTDFDYAKVNQTQQKNVKLRQLVLFLVHMYT